MLNPSTIHCMPTKSTINIDPGFSETVHFTPVDPRDAPGSFEFLYFPIHRYTQVIREPIDVTHELFGVWAKKVWKPFQNYKIWSGHPAGTSAPIYTSQWGYASRHHVGSTTNAYATYWSCSTAGAYGEPFGEAGKFNANLPPYYLDDDGDAFIPPPSNLNQLQQHAVRQMLPSVKSELSSLNSLIELKDFKSLPKSLLNLRSVIPLLLKRKPVAIGHSIRTMADWFLQWNFNVSPLIADLNGLRTVYTEHKKRIDALVNNTGGTRIRHFTWRWSENADIKGESSYYYWIREPWKLSPLAGYVCTRSVINEPSVFHAEIQYNYNYTAYQKQNAALLGILDMLGINLNPAIVWNAIPWSFVIDWVLSVSQALEQFKTLNLEPVVNIQQYLWSIKRKRKIYVKTGVSPEITPGVLVDRMPVSLPVVTEEAYGRFIGYPDTVSLQATGLNPHEFTLGAAIVIARKRNPRNRSR